MKIEELAQQFVRDELCRAEPNDDNMPWKVLRSCLVRYARYHEVDKGKPGRINTALREALEAAGYERIPAEGDQGGAYPTKLYVGSWPDFVGEIDRLMAEEGRVT